MSDFRIFDIKDIQPEPDILYLIDTNIWLSILNARPHPKAREQKYQNFLAALRRTKVSPKPKVALPGFIVSEIINAGLNIKYKLFKTKNYRLPWTDNYKDDFKKLYRPSDDFKGDYELLCYELKNYHQLFEIVNDGFEDFKLKQILRDLPTNLDYNDNYFYLLAKKRNYTIITDDGDFFVPGVNIVTANNTLLSKHKDFISTQEGTIPPNENK